jgi:ATP/maltotriose-dependent transcriptional regulator MalT
MALTEALHGRDDQAVETVNGARKLCESLGERGALLASVLCAQGSVLADKGELPRAEHQLLESARMADESKARLWVAWADYERAHTLLRQGRPSHARDLAFRAMDNFTGMRHRYGTARCRFLTGQALREENRWAEAAIELEEATAGFRTCNDDWMEAQAKELLGEVLRRAFPDRKHQANKLRASAADSFRLLAAGRRNAAVIAETERLDRDT